ncbi:MAG: hypothetical protein HDR21_14050 [Lachnospiraceae bacterium]|nr:hypothetical protein [Lachnospiraceae bacterium]
MGLFGIFKKKKPATSVSVKIDLKTVETEPVGTLSRVPFDTSKKKKEPATERQIAYAQDLGVVFQSDISKSDLSCLISRATGDDSKEGPEPDIVDLAVGLGIDFSPYIGARGLLHILFSSVGDHDRAALFAYGVRQNMRGEKFGNMLKDPDVDRFGEFGDLVLADVSLLRSLNDRPAEDLLTPRKGTKIYTAAAGFLSDGDLI